MPFGLSLDLTLGSTALSKGVPVNPYGAYLFYDDFSGAVAALSGRAPDKGPAWSVSGASAGGMTAGGGVMKQSAADASAGYAMVNHGQVPKKVVGEWLMTSGNFAYPATMGIHADSSLMPMLHGEGGAENFYIRLVSSGPTFIDPLFSLFAPNWTLATNTPYRDELHYNGGKMAAMVKRAENGDIIGQELVYDFRMPSFVGEMSFWETLTNRINYTLATAEAISDYAWPTITEIAGLANPTTASMAATVFGGSTTNSGSGIIIAGAGYGQGGQISVGSVTTGDKIHFAFDADGLTSSQMEVALLKTGAMEAEKSSIVYFASSGRISGTLTATETMASAGLGIVVSPTGSAGQVTVSNLQILASPPTGF